METQQMETAAQMNVGQNWDLPVQEVILLGMILVMKLVEMEETFISKRVMMGTLEQVTVVTIHHVMFLEDLVVNTII